MTSSRFYTKIENGFQFQNEGDFLGYNTKQQEAILNCLKSTKGEHKTAEDIYLLLKNQGLSVGKTTVYRHLDKLTNEGVVRRFTVGDNSGACYQIADSHCAEHHHLKCSKCGRLIHMECNFLDDLAGHLEKEHGFILDKGKTVLYGVCSQCAKEDKK